MSHAKPQAFEPTRLQHPKTVRPVGVRGRPCDRRPSFLYCNSVREGAARRRRLRTIRQQRRFQKLETPMIFKMSSVKITDFETSFDVNPVATPKGEVIWADVRIDYILASLVPRVTIRVP